MFHILVTDEFHAVEENGIVFTVELPKSQINEGRF